MKKVANGKVLVFLFVAVWLGKRVQRKVEKEGVTYVWWKVNPLTCDMCDFLVTRRVKEGDGGICGKVKQER